MKNQVDDFNPEKTLKRLAAHIDQPAKFAEIFCDAAKTQKPIENTLKDIIHDLLKNDHLTIERVKTLQREVDKESWRFFIKKLGASGWALIWLIIGSVITTSIGIIMKKF